ncbi:MAG: hypothetical protein GY820_03320 [Gammaproteobacteria bacterium]|nr:hypothetical protein [Gammaproteobacteria bacterium]
MNLATRILIFYCYNSLLKRGVRIALRAKVNDSLVMGLRVIDSLLPIGRGQRQLILGDRYSGKTSIYLVLLIKNNSFSVLGSIDGFGTKRIFAMYIGINQNLSKLSKLISLLSIVNYISNIITSHSSSCSLLSFMIPYIGSSINERLRDRIIDSVICFDDISKHAKCYRQISLLVGKIPSRDAYPSDIFNIHSSILERGCKLNYNYFGASISCFPIIETINSDITEFIATNVISITDGQLYTNNRLFIDGIRPAIDSGLSVSRIGSNAQCKLIKLNSIGMKNELTNLRNIELESNSFIANKFLTLKYIFIQDHLFISSYEITLLLLIGYKNNKLIINNQLIHTMYYYFYNQLFYLYYIIFINKFTYSYYLHFFIISFFTQFS